MRDFNAIYNRIYNSFIMQSMKKINSFLKSAKLSYHNALLMTTFQLENLTEENSGYNFKILSKNDEAFVPCKEFKYFFNICQ